MAYVVPRTADTTYIRENLHCAAESLPVHMRPARIYLIDAIPRLPSFKPNIKKLQSLEISNFVKTARKAEPQLPVNEREAKVLAICRQLLKIDDLSLSDNFFDAGGNSLLAMTLMLEIEAQLGFEISLDTIFDCPTIRKLCAALDEKAERAPAVILPVKFGQRNKTLYFTHSGFDFSALSAAMQSDISTAFITANGAKWLHQLAAGQDILAAVERISEACAQTIFARHGTEACCLAGHSFGGIIALETACKLEELGATPDVVFLFDTYLHSSIHRIFYDIRHNGWLTRKFKEFVQGNRHEIGRRASFLSRYIFYRLTRFAMFEKPRAVAEKDVNLIFRGLREEASQVYRGPARRPTSRTVLFRATKSIAGRTMRIDPDLGWAGRLGENLTVIMTPGNHETMLGSEYVASVASEIDRQVGSAVTTR